MTSLEKINKICIRIMKLDESEIDQALKEAKEQTEYTHPLKNKTASDINSIGDRNIRILNSFKELHKELKS